MDSHRQAVDFAVIFFMEGDKAGLDGEPRGVNPYPAGSAEWRLWDNGWMAPL